MDKKIEAGPELDTLMAEKVMGLRERPICWMCGGRYKIPQGCDPSGNELPDSDCWACDRGRMLHRPYSTDLVAAYRVAEKLGIIFGKSPWLEAPGYIATVGGDSYADCWSWDFAETPALAICLAALKYLEEKEKGINYWTSSTLVELDKKIFKSENISTEDQDFLAKAAKKESGFTIVSAMVGMVLMSIAALTFASLVALEAKTRKTAQVGHEIDSFMHNAESLLYRQDKCSQALNGNDFTAPLNLTDPFTESTISNRSGNGWSVSSVVLKNVTSHECYKRADLEITFNSPGLVGSSVKVRTIAGVFFLNSGNLITSCYGRTPPYGCTDTSGDYLDQFDDNGKDKVYVCHVVSPTQKKTLKVSKASHDAHLKEHSDDYDGAC